MADAPFADLHLHTHHSDGRDSPADLVRRAQAAGLALIAITDHETVAGVEEAAGAGRALGLEVVGGLEISVHQNQVEAHLLGLWIDINDQHLLALLRGLRQDRLERARAMIEKLHRLGLEISFDDLLAGSRLGSLGRLHVGRALKRIGAVASVHEAFSRYLGREGPAYVPRRRVDPVEAIDVIHRAGGLVALAHGLTGRVEREQVEKLIELGVDALEVVHPRLDDAKAPWLREQARRRGLGLTGGSDWHGDDHGYGEIGKYAIGFEAVEDLRRRLPPRRWRL